MFFSKKNSNSFLMMLTLSYHVNSNYASQEIKCHKPTPRLSLSSKSQEQLYVECLSQHSC